MSESQLEKARKLLALAFDRIDEPEGAVASVMFVRELKRSGVPLEVVLNQAKRSEDAQPAEPEGTKRDDKEKPSGISEEALRRARFPFGKYKGRKMWEVVQEARDYLVWVSENVSFNDEKLNRVVEELLKKFPETDSEDGDIFLGD